MSLRRDGSVQTDDCERVSAAHHDGQVSAAATDDNGSQAHACEEERTAHPDRDEKKLKALRDVVAQCRSSVNRRPSATEIRDKLQRLL